MLPELDYVLNLLMDHLLQTPPSYPAQASYSLWLVLHGAFAKADQALAIFGPEAAERDTFLLAPQATRPCDDGYCWSFARDAKEIHHLIERTCATYLIDRSTLSLIGYSMGCTMARDAQSAWLWIKADVSGCRIEASAEPEATLLGAALVAGIGSSLYANEAEAFHNLCLNPVEVFLPDSERHAVYRHLYEQSYLRLQEVLRHHFAEKEKELAEYE